MASTLLVTGGAGFIGSALIRLLLRESDYRIVNVDKLSYVASPEALANARAARNRLRERARKGKAKARKQAADAVGAASSDAVEALLCIICFEEAKTVVFGCQHMCCCGTCADSLKECPMCRAPITFRMRVFI